MIKRTALFLIHSVLVGQGLCADVAQFKLSEDSWDFGTINDGKHPETAILLTNVGQMDLRVISVSASCGCTVVECDKSPIPPGKSTELRLRFISTGRKGAQARTVTIVSNAANGKELTIQVKGFVLPGKAAPLQLQPSGLDFGRVTNMDKPQTRQVFVRNTGAEAVTITAIGGAPPILTADIAGSIELLPGKEASFEVTLHPECLNSAGNAYFARRIVVYLDNGNNPANAIKATAYIAAEAEGSGQLATLSGKERDAGVLLPSQDVIPIPMHNLGAGDLVIVGVKLESSVIECPMHFPLVVRSHQQESLRLRVRDNAPRGAFAARVTILSAVGEESVGLFGFVDAPSEQQGGAPLMSEGDNDHATKR